jgi:2-oxoacid dehydrogenases acyltransferase (catalytic domain)
MLYVKPQHDMMMTKFANRSHQKYCNDMIDANREPSVLVKRIFHTFFSTNFQIKQTIMEKEMESYDDYPFKVVETPSNRTLVVDAGALAAKRHVIYGFLEADVTRAKHMIHHTSLSNDSTSSPDTALSFTAYIAHCVAKTVAENPAVQAYRQGGWRSNNKLIIFQDVDVVIMIEPRENETAFPHIIRQANKKTVLEISQEIRRVKNNPKSSGQQYDNNKSLKFFARLPKWLRMIIYQQMSKDPQALRKRQGTVMLTSVGMFGKEQGRGGWGLTFLPMHTLGITLGGIQRKPVVVVVVKSNVEQNNNVEQNIDKNHEQQEEQIAIRDVLSLTVAFDHDIVDGAPAARFASNLIDAIEQGENVTTSSSPT